MWCILSTAMGVHIKDKKRDLREMPAYGINEAAHYLGIPKATLRSWVLGRPYPKRIQMGRRSGLLNTDDPMKDGLSEAGSPRDKASGGKDSNGLEPPVFPFYYLPHMLYSKLHEQSSKRGC